MLVHQDFRDAARVESYVRRCAEKRPTAIIVSAGVGGPVYAMEAIALDAGLRVAAFRHEVAVTPAQQQTWRDPDSEDVPAVPETRWRTALEEIGADGTTKTRVTPYGLHVGYRAAEEASLRAAVAHADHTVVFCDVAGWPPFDVPDAQRLGKAA